MKGEETLSLTRKSRPPLISLALKAIGPIRSYVPSDFRVAENPT